MARPRYPSTITDPTPVAQRLIFPNGRIANNRLVKAAMSERLASFHPTNVEERGIPSPELIRLYQTWGLGGWGMILTGNILIDPEHLEAPGNSVISLGSPFSGRRFEAFSKLAHAAKVHGSLVIGQVSHPGRVADPSVQPNSISASNVEVVIPGFHAKPHPATKEEIKRIVEGFGYAAEYLEKAGFDGMQVHGAHGLLVSQFLSSSTNLRMDEYGGSLVNRMRFLMEIVDAVQARTSKDFILGIKLNAIELGEKPLTKEEVTAVAQALEKAGVDFVEFSGGSFDNIIWHYLKENHVKREGYYLPWVDEILKTPLEKMKVLSTGGFRTLDGIVPALRSIDAVGIGKPATHEPSLPISILSGEATGVYTNAADSDTPFKRLMLSIGQMREIGIGKEITDLTVKENVDHLLTILQPNDPTVGQNLGRLTGS
ncbi:nadh oxidase [Colletotrichum incanum]|uniref:Nadh oxidase n=1 Tax=Colletotrichum incanum TaxID=1573173 RepID=A0A161VHN2_COLIC|nr:nadh oxidase [Colletotrichum incanum]OHW90771.1 NADH oxidase [Colletotrichum incanum]